MNRREAKRRQRANADARRRRARAEREVRAAMSRAARDDAERRERMGELDDASPLLPRVTDLRLGRDAVREFRERMEADARKAK